MLEDKKSFAKRWQLVIVLSFTFLTALIAQDLIREILVFNQDVQVIEEELERDIRKDVHDLVENVNTEVEYILEHLRTNAELHAKDNVSNLDFALRTIVMLHEGLTEAELMDDIKLVTQMYNLEEPEHIYSLYTTDGIELYNGFTDTFTDVNILGKTDYLGRN